MPAKRTDLDTDYLVREYLAGRTAKDLASQFNVSNVTILSRLKAAGVMMWKTSALPPAEILAAEYVAGATAGELAVKYGVNHKSIRARIKPICGTLRPGGNVAPVVDVAAAVELFNSGIGIGGISERLGNCSTTYLAKLFREQGVKTRNRSEQQFARMGRTTAEERQALSKAAHDAVRGVKVSPEALINRSNARCKTVSKYERQLMHMLTERGVTTEPQLPIGPYNCDLASGTVAVEVFGGGWHWHGKHLAMTEERFRYILNAGWDLLVVPVNVWGCCLNSSVADYVAAYIKRSNSNPTRRREYRVIWRGGECFTTGSLDDDYISIIPPFTNRRNPANGRYETVPR